MKLKHQFVFFFVLILFSAIYCQEKELVIDSLYIADQMLVLDFHLENFFDSKMIDGLKHGLTSEMIFSVQLWKKRFLFSSLKSENMFSVILYYDNWQKKYAVIKDEERLLSSDLDRIEVKSTRFARQQVLPLQDLDQNASYFVGIQTTFQPISDQTFQELSQWLSKNEKENHNAQPVKRGRVFPLFLDLIGLGDKEFSIKSEDFAISQKGIFYKDQRNDQ
ncbi:DUF4390 domain-containing protein [candidate division KSB1 bacterium]|nr:DUF4390 domain-containing protein [candidate division KSB1 bacterium]